MIIKHVDEMSFQRRPYGLLDAYLDDSQEGDYRRRLIARLKPDECIAIVSKNGMHVLFLRGFDTVRAGDNIARALSFHQISLDRKWDLATLQNYASKSRMPFKVHNVHAFDDLMTDHDYRSRDAA